MGYGVVGCVKEKTQTIICANKESELRDSIFTILISYMIEMVIPFSADVVLQNWSAYQLWQRQFGIF